jgi:hypothetical protein
MADAQRERELKVNEAMETQGISGAPTAASRSAGRLALALTAFLAAVLLWAVPAQAWEGFYVANMEPSLTQAGGHPDVKIEMNWDNSLYHEDHPAAPSNPCLCDDPKIAIQHFPTGFIGNPNATPQCQIVEFSFGRCPPASQVGIVEPIAGLGFAPLYNVQPHPQEPALTAFWVPLIQAPVFISLAGRTESDYGLNAESSPIFRPLPGFHVLSVELWGVPASPVHTTHRFEPPLKGFGLCLGTPEYCATNKETGAPANVTEIPYLENPTTCDVPLTAQMDLLYYTGGLVQKELPWPSTTGCQQLTFNPSLTAEPTTDQSDTPTGVDVDLKVPQEQNPDTPSPSELKASITTLPAGFSINPSAADGKTTCSDADTQIGTRNAATCPETSKVGSVVLDSSALPAPIPGFIYLGDPKPGDKYRLVLAASGWGTNFKVVGSVRPDPSTGQLTVAFENLPQSPLTEFNMHFFGSERGLLATPTKCGQYPVESEFVPWDTALPAQQSVSTFTVDSGPSGAPCPSGPRPFSPGFQGGTANTTAGMHSPLTLEFTRSDGDQNLSTLGLTTSPGLLASLRGIPYCSDAQIAAAMDPAHTGAAELAAPSCPATSQIGTLTAGAGAGTHPVYLPGKAYLAGPYKGSQLSMVFVTPAVSGPYDLGNVVVRAALNVDPVTAQVTAQSDPLPQIVDGVPLRLRSIRVKLDRPGFMLNPTDCAPSSLAASLGGNEGALAGLKTPFQIANCASLPYKPSLALTLSGGVNRLGHPAIHTLLRTKDGEANSGRVVVALPKNEQVDQAHLSDVCTRVQFAANACPAGSQIGEAKASTPLLDKPLTGDVFLRTSSHVLPDMVVKLHGQIDIEFAGRIDTTKGGSLRTTFDNLPDAPVSTFELNLFGGKHGLVVNSNSLCGKPERAIVKMTGQNGAQAKSTPKLRVSCGSGQKHKKHPGSSHPNGRKAGH